MCVLCALMLLAYRGFAPSSGQQQQVHLDETEGVFIKKIDSEFSDLDIYGVLRKIGTPPLSLAEIRSELPAFQRAYDIRPVVKSVGGSNMFHAFAQWRHKLCYLPFCFFTYVLN